MAWSTSIKIEGLDKLKKGLSELEVEQYPFAMKNTLNNIAEKVRAAQKTEMSIAFDRPTPFTLNALRIKYAKKTDLSAQVLFKDPPRLSESQHYLYPNVYGVKRGFKKFEAALYARGLMPAGYYAVPGKTTKKDAYGNVSNGLIVEILSWFGANQNAGYSSASTSKTKAKKRKGTKSTFGYEFFAVRKKKGKMLPGIYRRVYLWDDTTQIYPVFIFVPKNQVGYQRHYKFYEVANFVFNNNFKQTFNNEMQSALRTAF